MANPTDKPDPNPPKLEPEPREEGDEEADDLNGDGGEEDDDDATGPKPRTREDRSSADRLKVKSLFRRMRASPVPVRVHDVIIKGNEKTKDHVIEAEVEVVKRATTLQELLKASRIANFNLQALEIFDSVDITLDSGPQELPGTTNVVIQVVESKNPLIGQIGAYTKAEARSSSIEASLKYKNIFGYGDIWDGSLAYDCDNSAEVSFGLHLPRFKGLPTPFTSRLYLLTQDWLRPISNGIEVNTEAAGEIDLRYALPLGFNRAALNLGISGGITFPWGNGYRNIPTSLPERFFLGGNLSPVCSLGGPSALWGFKTRGLGPNEPRREIHDESADPSERDFIGGDLVVTAFADLSFDFPLRLSRDSGIHGHVFACAGNLAKLSETEYQNLASKKFLESFRTSVGIGIVLPTNLFRIELNYCHILKKQEHDRAKSGFFLTFSAAS